MTARQFVKGIALGILTEVEVEILATICLRNPGLCKITIPIYVSGGAQMPDTTDHIIDAIRGNGSNGKRTEFILNSTMPQDRPFIRSGICGKKARNAYSASNGGIIGACDEFPFSTSKQGGPSYYHNGEVSLRLVPYSEQSRQGGQLRYFYDWAGIARDGVSRRSRFIAIGVPGVKSFAINRNAQVYVWPQ